MSTLNRKFAIKFFIVYNSGIDLCMHYLIELVGVLRSWMHIFRKVLEIDKSFLADCNLEER